VYNIHWVVVSKTHEYVTRSNMCMFQNVLMPKLSVRAANLTTLLAH